jgi:ankyrin repeat protein
LSIEDDFKEALRTKNFWPFLSLHGCSEVSSSTGEKMPEEALSNPLYKKYADVYVAFQLAKEGKSDVLIESSQLPENAMANALKSGQLDIAKYLYGKGAELYYIELSSCSDEKTRVWFQDELKKALAESYPDPTYDVAPSKKNLFFRIGEWVKNRFNKKCIPPLHRAIELGDLEFIKSALTKASPKVRHDALAFATKAKLLPMIKFLHEQGISLNPEVPFRHSALLEAVQGGDDSIIDYYLSASDINVDTQDSRKITPLMEAVNLGAMNTVKKLLAKGASTKLKTVNSGNVLHGAVLASRLDMIAHLAETSDFQSLLRQESIYGQTPMDMAISAKKNDVIKILDSAIDLEQVKKLPAYGKALVATKQSFLIPKIKAYLTSQKRSLAFTSEGYCNGLAYLFLIYSAQNKENYFFDTLGLMINWDGKVETLEKPFPPNLPQAAYYKNLKELFEQWINDIFLFQASYGSEILDMPHYERGKQHDVIGKIEDLRPVFLYTERERSWSPPNRSAVQLREVLGYLMRMPIGCRFEMGGGHHAISLYKNSEGKIKLFDPNFYSKVTDSDDVDEAAQRIIDYKYILLEKYGDKVAIYIDVLYFKKDEKQLDFENFHVFSDEELPKSKQEAEAFQAKSPSRFTHLHVAVMTHSLPVIKKLLEENHCDLMAVDEEGRTVLDMVFKTRCVQQDIAELFLFSPHVQGLEKFLFSAIDRNKQEMIGIVLESGKADINKLFPKEESLDDPIKFKSVLSEAVSKPTILPLFIKQLKNINALDATGNAPLHHAIRRFGQAESLQILLDHGADPNLPDGEGRHPIDVLAAAYMDFVSREQIFKILIPHLSQEKLIEYLFKCVSESRGSAYSIFVYPALLEACKNNKAILNARNPQGLAALHVAAMEKQFSKARKLVKAGCDVDALLMPSRNSLLTSLVKLTAEEDEVQRYERYQLIDTLLEYKAEVNLRNANGECALDLVKDSTDEELKAIFVKRGLILEVGYKKS